MLYCKMSREHSPSAYLVVLDPSKLDRRIRNADALCTNFPGFDGVRFHTEAAWVVPLEAYLPLEESSHEEFQNFDTADLCTWFESSLDIGEPVTATVFVYTYEDGVFALRVYIDEDDHEYETEWLKWEDL